MRATSLGKRESAKRDGISSQLGPERAPSARSGLSQEVA
jgi:hypothetical protein